MDKKFKSDDEWWISPRAHLATFFRTALHELNATHAALKLGEDYVEDDSTFEELSNISAVFKEKLFADVSLEKLLKAEDAPAVRPVAITYDDLNIVEHLRPESLKCHSWSNERLHRFKNSSQKGVYIQHLKYYKYDGYGAKLTQVDPDVKRFTPPDFVLSVTFLAPHSRMYTLEERRMARMKIDHYKFICRGDMPLLSLRRRLFCSSDLGTRGDDGQTVEEDLLHSCVKQYPSAFMYIDDTFYLDRTEPNSIDISEEIREFMKRKKDCFGPTKTMNMEGVLIKDLTLRLGQPYVFQHSGNCEHIMIFTDLRLMTKDDEQDLQNYPVLATERRSNLKCYACMKLEATMCVEGNTRLPMTPAFFCRDCFQAFHYSHGKKLGDFKAFPFFLVTKTF